MTTKKKTAYYTIDRIKKENADYNIIIGERGNGKTYSVQKEMIERFLKGGEQCFILRRWMEDVKPSNAQNFWDGKLTAKLHEMSGGRFRNIILKSNRYIAVDYDDKDRPIVNEENTVGYVWDLNEAERLKGQSFPFVTNIVFEEFISLSQMGYLPDEVTYFLNVLSTIIRDRTNVKIWMLGNTVNPYNPYFKHFGIKGLELQQGTIWTKYDSVTGCKLAVEFCEQRRKGSLKGTSAKYFAFGTADGSTDMIITGQWQLPDYPLKKFRPAFSRKRMMIRFDDHLMSFHLMTDDRARSYLYVRDEDPKTHIDESTIVLDLQPSLKRNHFTAFQNLPSSEENRMIAALLSNRKVYFDDRMTGAYFFNFLAQSQIELNRV